jgi:hypothetical protein
MSENGGLSRNGDDGPNLSLTLGHCMTCPAYTLSSPQTPVNQHGMSWWQGNLGDCQYAVEPP